MTKQLSLALNVVLAVALVAVGAALITSNNGSDADTEEPATQAEQAGEWTQIAPTDLDDNPFALFRDAMALAVGDSTATNAMAIGWGELGVLWGRERPVVTVYVEERRFTKHLMDENEYFTVEAFDKDYDRVIRYLGSVSGRDEDKIVGSGLTLIRTEHGAPAFDEGRLLLECRKIYQAPFDPAGFGDVPKEVYSDRPLHTMYIGEITAAYVK